MTECQSLFQPLNADTGGTTQAATALPRRAYPEHEGGRGQRRETASATARGPPGESEGEEGQKRQREVVDRLHGKRPSRSDAAPDGARSVVLSKECSPQQEARVEEATWPEVAPVSYEYRLQAKPGDEQDHPVRGQNPERTVAQVRRERRQLLGP